MHSLVQRFFIISATALLSCVAMAGMVAASTFVRNGVLHPRPIFTNMQVVATPVRRMAGRSFVSAEPEYNLYSVNGKLESNVMALSDLGDAGQSGGRRSRLFPVVRFFDRTQLTVSGTVDFASCWDWNTKSIFVALLARYKTSGARLNEVIFLDAMIRNVAVPSQLRTIAALAPEERNAEQHATWRAFEERTLLTPHDHESLYIDHIHKKLYLNQSFKYYLEDFYADSLANAELEVVMRYQVMSYSGWAPLREDVIGGRGFVVVPPPQLNSN